MNGKFVKPKDAREVAAYLSSYFVRGRGHKAPLAEAVTNGELPRLPLYVSRRLTSVTRTTMRNKRRQRHLHVCESRGLSKPPWWQDEREREDVLALSLPVRDRLRLFAELGRAVGTNLDGSRKAACRLDWSGRYAPRVVHRPVQDPPTHRPPIPSRADHHAAWPSRRPERSPA